MNVSRLENPGGSPATCCQEGWWTERLSEPYPAHLARQRGEICAVIAHIALALHGFCQRLSHLFAEAGGKNGSDYQASAQYAAQMQAEMRALGLKAQRTADSLEAEVCDLDEWRRRAAAGLILDVFSEASLQVLLDYLEEGKRYVDESLAFLEGLGV